MYILGIELTSTLIVVLNEQQEGKIAHYK